MIESIYVWIIFILLISAGYVYYIYKTLSEKIALKQSKEIAYRLMLYAEKNFETDKEKFQWVAQKFYETTSSSIKDLITQDMIEDFLQETYDEMKEVLNN
ncbi:hypothetical protein [Tepidibacter aestuarii]|uniref:hypothetical protein n=1 Tax=Tepidibacter aestuarii TaxID=2925782 RepID=UPI0020C0B891|nr:hypothetical protein [Tepidibacter aestuarii]CAH2213648.1 conserved protein of unknown function [Tepidibacter aestuarii]CAH2215654.1 conserved protein of unknown function [Tepidibacter aestuarii]